MTEILTESFCERCGTRYTFESARPKTRLKGVKVMTRGLKNFVLSDDTSMDEAMAAARSETERESTAYQLDAFHKTFNFCMQCRQYTCPNCWNEAEARCLTCAPHLGHEIMPAPFPDLPAPSAYLAEPIATDVVDGQNGANGWHTNGAEHDTEPGFDFAARLAALTALPTPAADPAPVVEPEAPAPAAIEAAVEPAPPPMVDEPAPATPVQAAPEPVAPAPLVPEAMADAPGPVAEVAPAVTPAPVARPAPEPVADVAASADPAAEPDAATDADDADIARRLATLGAAAVVGDAVTAEPADRSIDDKMASQTSGLLKRFRPGQSLDAEIASYERAQEHPVVAPAEVVVAAEAVSAATPDAPAAPAEVAEPAPEPAVAAGPAPEPIAPEPEPVAPMPAEPTPAEPTPVPPVADVVSQPTWQMVAPDPTVAAPNGEPPATMPAAASAADPSAEPQWPERPQWLGGGPANGLPFLNRPAAPQGGIEALWAQSNAEVANPTGPSKPAGGTQPCVSCGLSLSATAKFCRRCGTPQAG